MKQTLVLLLALLAGTAGCAQQLGENPFTTPINTRSDVVTVAYENFARIPDAGGQPPRLMHMLAEPGSERLFVSTMPGKLYGMDYQGRSLSEFLDLTEYGIEVMDAGRERGLQSFDFHPQFAEPGTPGYGKFYTFVDVRAGGSGGDPLGTGQDLGNAFGKILRIDPLGRNSANGAYGIPTGNPFVGVPDALDEVYALGVRNPQRFGWDPLDGRMLVADIGQNQVEEISPVTAGANLGWNRWEGSFRYQNRRIVLDNPRSDPTMTWPIVEYDHDDPLLVGRAAISGVHVFRGDALPALAGTMVFSDIPSGELLYVPADAAGGGQSAIRRVLLDDNGEAKNLLQIIGEENTAQGRSRAQRADLRFGAGAEGELFLLNKADGVIRKLVP